MIRDPKKLHNLIREYARMERLEGYSSQSRGQRLNTFIAELLSCWGIHAESNLYGAGEIDVAFEFQGRQFIMEAKWESHSTKIGPITKLRKRIGQRLRGTIGIILSMTGFSRDALKDIKEGEELAILCLDRKHLEAMLTGFIPPEDLFSQLIVVGSRLGHPYMPIESLFKSRALIKKAQPFEHFFSVEEHIISSIPTFSVTTLFSGFPSSRMGMAKKSPDRLLITANNGIFVADFTRSKISPYFMMPGCLGNPIISPDGSVYVARRAGIAKIKDKRIEFVAGGFLGNVFLFAGPNQNPMAFSGGGMDDSEGLPLLISVGDRLGEQSERIINYPCSAATAAEYIDGDSILLCGGGGIFIINPETEEVLIPARNSPLTNPLGIVNMGDGRFVIASHHVKLFELVISKRSLREIADIRLFGGAELIAFNGSSGYLSSFYLDTDNQYRVFLAKWSY